ncbi:Lipoprotein signal peptidase [Buchnera aphidicola (Takecallis arundicolens)]
MKKEKIVNFYNKYYIIYMILIIDIYSKYLIENNITLYENKKFFYIIHLIYIKNYGIAFNVFDLYYIKHKYVFIILYYTLTYFYIITFLNKNHYSYKFILGGSISNIIDRLYHGFIVDFIDIRFKNYSIIIFNFADIMILIGIVLIICNLYTQNQTKK